MCLVQGFLYPDGVKEVRQAQAGIFQCALCREYLGREAETEVEYRLRNPRAHRECLGRVTEIKASMGQCS